MLRPLSLLVLFGAVAPSASAQEFSLAAGPTAPVSANSRLAEYDGGPTFGARVARPFSPTLALDLDLRYVRFVGDPSDTGFQFYGLTVGGQVRPLPSSFVGPYGRAGVGLGNRTFPGAFFRARVLDLAGGVAVGPGKGPFGYAEAGVRMWHDATLRSGYYSVQAGVGYRL